MLTLIADENIANLDDYIAHHDINLIKLSGRQITGDIIRQHQAHGLFIRSVTPVNVKNFGNLSDTPLRFIGSATIGTDHIDFDYLQQSDIAFTNAAGCSKHSVAQYVITAILHTQPKAYHTPITLGIIGLGNIGTTLASYAHAMGWQTLGHDPFLPASKLNNASFAKVLTADVISIHTPLSHAGKHPTAKLIDAAALKQIKNNAMLINTARGGIIDEAALLNTIKQKQLTVVLDVFADEPNISQNLLDNLHLATPHIAGYTLEGKVRGTDMIYQAFCQHFNLPICQTLTPLLPPNPYHFKELLNDFSADKLAQFYDIATDFHALKAVNHGGVSGKDFDQLRKNYRLRREWLF